MASTRNNALFKGKPIWCGSASLLDGYIEEVHTYEDARNEDFHHSLYFSIPQAEKISNGENTFFWIEDDGTVYTDWRWEDAPPHIVAAIKSQLTIN